MSDRPKIDIQQFGEAGGDLDGAVQVRSLERLRDVLSRPDGEVAYSIRGSIDEDRRPRLGIQIAGTLHLRCQRCLGPVPYRLALSRKLRFLPSVNLLPDVANDEEDVDDVILPRELDPVAWVEDEILLGLPISPRHDEGECKAPPNPAEEARAGTQHPFAALAELERETGNANDL